MVPERFGIKLMHERGIEQQFETIKQLVANAELVINCGDAGQEGELIQRWVLQLAECSVPVKRLVIIYDHRGHQRGVPKVKAKRAVR